MLFYLNQFYHFSGQASKITNLWYDMLTILIHSEILTQQKKSNTSVNVSSILG